MRLIDADALDELLKDCIARYKFVPEPIGIIRADEINAIRDLIKEQMPTVDAVPAKNGQWGKKETFDAYDIYGVKTWALKAKCSECGFVHHFIEAHMCYSYCPNCGAKMDGERRESE